MEIVKGCFVIWRPTKVQCDHSCEVWQALMQKDHAVGTGTEIMSFN